MKLWLSGCTFQITTALSLTTIVSMAASSVTGYAEGGLPQP